MADAIEDLLREDRTFPPPDAFRADARISDDVAREKANADPEAHWEAQAEELDWFQEWDTVLDWEAPFAKWFVGGTLNVSHNCLDRHVEAGHGGQVAYHFVGEPGDTRTITYAELLDDVQRAANALRALGVERGDRVAIYLPMIPELPTIMLACARIGAPHSVVFAGFSANALRSRINDATCKVLVTADGSWRRGSVFPLKEIRRRGARGHAVHREGARGPAHDAVRRARLDRHDRRPRRLLARPRAVRRTPTAPPSTWTARTCCTCSTPRARPARRRGSCTRPAATSRRSPTPTGRCSTCKPDDDVYWCAADIGWVTGHSYIVYGPLTNRTTSVMYEGAPNFPAQDRLWEIVETYGVTQLYTAPTAIRAFMKWGDEHPQGTTCRRCGCSGPSVSRSTRRRGSGTTRSSVVGRCPIVDTWWQTETGGIMISPLPGATTTKPGSATFPMPGVSADIVDDTGESVDVPGGGYLVLDRPWPSMLRGIWGDEQRYRDTYWSRFDGKYFAGDGAKRDADGYYWLLGRVDDVMNVAGHRLSTAEIESALVAHETVAEAAVIGRADSRHRSGRGRVRVATR